MIENIIDEHFGAYIDGDGVEIDLSFLPKEIFLTVPEEDRDKFFERYNHFAFDTNYKLGLVEIFNNEFMHRPNLQIVKAQLRNRIEQEIFRYDGNNPVPIKDVMKGYLGVPKYTVFLQQ